MTPHLWDLLPLVLLALLIFGPKRLPEMGSSIGKTIKEFQKSMKEVNEPTPQATITAAPQPVAPEIAAPSATVAAPSASVTTPATTVESTIIEQPVGD